MMRRVLLAAAESTTLEHLVTTRPTPRRIARRFIAGETLDDGVRAIREVAARGCTATLDFLGEDVAGVDDARVAQAAVIAACHRIAETSLPSGVSVKPTQLGLGLDPGVAFELIGGIASEAKRFGGHVNLDMEGSDATDATVAWTERLRAAGHDNVGCAVQAYLYRTPGDLERLTAAGASVRLVKGAYDEPPSVAYQDPADVAASFERSADWLLEHGHHPRIATHDERLIEAAKRTAIRLGRSPDDFEFQMLYGVRTPLQNQLVAAGWRMRVYIPFGSQWYRYFMRRIAERPANLAFFLRAVVGS